MTESNSVESQERTDSAFVPLPIPRGDVLCALGPRPDEAAAVHPLARLDEPLTLVASFVAGVCDPGGRLLRPAEIMLVVDPATVVPDRQIPTAAVLERFDSRPALLAKLPPPAGLEILALAFPSAAKIGPLLYCRKRRCIFAARSEADTEFPEVIAALDDLIREQRDVVTRAEKLRKRDRVAAARLAEEHACVSCDERQRCYPEDDGYAYFADRLVAISSANAPLIIAPLGEWRFDEACRIVGGEPPGELLASSTRPSNDFEIWRDDRATEMEHLAPPRLLSGETDGRELLEVARLKLGMIADVLAQLDAVWRETGRAHLCWNEETVRVAWMGQASLPGTCWGFKPLLRKVGLQPPAPVDAVDGRELAYPPAFSDSTFLPATAAAARYFDEPRKATLFVKKPERGDGAGMQVLLEDLGVPWELFRTSDTLRIAGDGWDALLAPADQRDPDDGDGLPFHGRATGAAVAGWKQGEQLDDVECRWYPRFGQAVDLHAVGVLMLEGLLAQDERGGRAFREALADQLAELSQILLATPIDQRDGQARNWLTERCEADAPAAIWSRRNLLQRRDDRNATRLDAFPAALWRAILLLGLRLTTGVPGFSFCNDRGCAAPRLDDETLLPLAELRGLIALLDDQLFGRTAPAGVVSNNVKSGFEAWSSDAEG